MRNSAAWLAGLFDKDICADILWQAIVKRRDKLMRFCEKQQVLVSSVLS